MFKSKVQLTAAILALPDSHVIIVKAERFKFNWDAKACQKQNELHM